MQHYTTTDPDLDDSVKSPYAPFKNDQQQQADLRHEAHTSKCLVYRLHSVSQIAHPEGEDHLEGRELIKTVCSLRSPQREP